MIGRHEIRVMEMNNRGKWDSLRQECVHHCWSGIPRHHNAKLKGMIRRQNKVFSDHHRRDNMVLALIYPPKNILLIYILKSVEPTTSLR